MSLESFNKLLEISDTHIDHQIVADDRYNAENIPKLPPNKQLSELFGIILGDGHIQNRSKTGHKTDTTTYFISITLNEEEDEIIDRSEYLLEEITDLDVKRYEKQGKCVRLVIHSKDAVEKFQEMGLEAGDKIENQVSVPRWIKQSEEFCRRCLKGLIDTDGCIYKDQRKNTYYERVQFKNYSTTWIPHLAARQQLGSVMTVHRGAAGTTVIILLMIGITGLTRLMIGA